MGRGGGDSHNNYKINPWSPHKCNRFTVTGCNFHFRIASIEVQAAEADVLLHKIRQPLRRELSPNPLPCTPYPPPPLHYKMNP